MMQIIELTEEEDLEVSSNELPEELALVLYHKFGGKVNIDFPSPVRENYRLRSSGYVGQILLSPDYLIAIHPKTPVNNLFRMLEYAYDLQSFEFLAGVTTTDSVHDIFERLASILARRILDRTRRGLYHSYLEHEDSLNYIRGRILIPQTIRAHLSGSANVVCEHEHFTADLDDNRILAWTLYRLSRFHFDRAEVRQQVRQAFHALSSFVSVKHLSAKDCIGRLYNKLNSDYRPIHGLCRFFLEHSGPGLKVGEYDALPFLVHMPTLYEAFVDTWLRTHIPEEYAVVSQYHAPISENGKLRFRIDLVLRHRATDTVFAVMDTKYKRVKAPAESDMQQIVAYATRMKTQKAFLIYPSEHTDKAEYPVGDISVFIINFDIGNDLEQAGEVFIDELLDLANGN